MQVSHLIFVHAAWQGGQAKNGWNVSRHGSPKHEAERDVATRKFLAFLSISRYARHAELILHTTPSRRTLPYISRPHRTIGKKPPGAMSKNNTNKGIVWRYAGTIS